MSREKDDFLRIGDALKKLRKRAGLSQIDLASGICDRTTITHLENGKFKLPSIVLINKICQKLNLTLDEFLMFAFGGFVDHLWIRRNEIDSLIKKGRV